MSGLFTPFSDASRNNTVKTDGDSSSGQDLPITKVSEDRFERSAYSFEATKSATRVPVKAKKPWWRRVVICAIGVVAGVLVLWALFRWLQAKGFFTFASTWLSLDSGLTGPLATLLAGCGAIAAATIAFLSGEKSRKQEREKWEESKQRETERSLRDRYFSITELLSGDSSYMQREAAVNSLVALSDDWASFYGGSNVQAAHREQQTCLNVIVGQLRDPFPPDDEPAKDDKKAQLIVFKQRVQNVIIQRFKSAENIDGTSGSWCHLVLDLSYCHLYEPDFSTCLFIEQGFFRSVVCSGERTDFSRAIFRGKADFGGAIFKGLAVFEGVTFARDIYFERVIFENHAIFKDANFKGRANFRGATFENYADFTSKDPTRAMNFEGDVDFGKVIFKTDAIFEGAAFECGVSFVEAKFEGEAQFLNATFKGKADFWNANFNKSALFDGSPQFASQPVFFGTEFAKKPILAKDDRRLEDFFVGATMPQD